MSCAKNIFIYATRSLSPMCLCIFFTADFVKFSECEIFVIAFSLCHGVDGQIPVVLLWQVRLGSARENLTLVPVALACFSLLEEGPYEGVYNVRLVLLQPVTGPGNNVETEMISDVETASLSHLLLQEGISLAPQQQDWRSDVILTEGQGATKTNKRKYCIQNCFCVCVKQKLAIILLWCRIYNGKKSIWMLWFLDGSTSFI